mgnify:CR=1 FL=1
MKTNFKDNVIRVKSKDTAFFLIKVMSYLRPMPLAMLSDNGIGLKTHQYMLVFSV